LASGELENLTAFNHCLFCFTHHYYAACTLFTARSFVQAALDDKRSNKLVTGIIKIGLDLNLRVLVEGIETA
ncbi:hypothetical protein RFX53_16665, partial [Acinetobacter baumannii]|nr:hypothetical protein [Acinetobacter baumannii]